MPTFLSQIDQIFVGIILIFGVIGVIRGFLKELTSIFNWVMTCYLTSIMKPFILEYLNIKIPFFGDIIVNFVLFVILIIVVSLISSLFISFFKDYVKGEVNSILGLIFGCLKGYLIVLLILSFRNILYKGKNNNEFSENCKVCEITKEYQIETQKLLETLLGDFIDNSDDKSNKIDENKEETIDNENLDNVSEKNKINFDNIEN